MDIQNDCEQPAGSKSKKRSWLAQPRVKLMPDFRGARVIEGEHGGEQLVGQLFPWSQFYYYGQNLRLCDEHLKRFRIDDSLLSAQFVGGTRLASRLRYRSIKQWLAHGIDPIEFETPKESVKGWYLGALIAVSLLAGAFFYLLNSLLTGTQNRPQGVPIGLALIILSPLILMALLLLWASWSSRSRERSFEFVRLMPQGLVGECPTRTVAFDWHKLRSARLFPANNGVRVRYITSAGERYWVSFPRPLRDYPGLIHGKPKKPPIYGADRAMVIQGVRFIVIGFLLGLIARTVFLQFPNWLPNAPPFPPHLPNAIFWVTFALPAMLGLMYLYLAVKQVPRVRRHVHALTIRWAERKKHTQDEHAEHNTRT